MTEMTIEKAIEILSEAAYAKAFTTGNDWYDALKLAIRGLKLLQLLKVKEPI